MEKIYKNIENPNKIRVILFNQNKLDSDPFLSLTYLFLSFLELFFLFTFINIFPFT